MESINPATGKVMKRFRTLSVKEALKEVEKSRKAFVKWRDRSVDERGRYIKRLAGVLKKRREELARLATKEMGKPITQARAEVAKGEWLASYLPKHANKFLKDEVVKTEAKKSYVTFEPLGVILGIMPWNYPYTQVLRFAISALAAGNVCVVKHSSNVPQCALAINKVFREAGFPKDVFKMLLIDSKTALGLIDADLVDGVSFTGSTAAGKRVAERAGRNVKKVVLELGGSDPFIVLEDADVEFSCKIGVRARMGNAGQSCTAAKRFIVVKKVAKEFIKKFVGYTCELKVGDPMDEETEVGPLSRKDRLESIERQVKDAVKKGAKVLCGGKRIGKGYFYEPTVLTKVKRNMAVLREEVFGPVAPIVVVENEKEAIEKANDTDYGLAASIWSRNIKKAEKLAKKIEAGNVAINGSLRSDPRLPFGGVKKSGYGRELSEYGIKEFVNIKTVILKG